jgi:hypothetical protein
MKTVTTRPYAVVLAAAAVVIAAGCTGDPTPPPAGAATPPASSTSTIPTPTTSSATSTTPTATPSTEATDPNIPPAAKAQTSDGAVAFTGYFAAQANASYQTLNPELLTPLVISECKTCTAMIKQINEYITRQQKYVGEFITPTATTISSASGDQAQVFLSTDSKGGRVVDSKGNTVEQLAPQRGSVTIYLVHRSGSWRVSEIKANA